MQLTYAFQLDGLRRLLISSSALFASFLVMLKGFLACRARAWKAMRYWVFVRSERSCLSRRNLSKSAIFTLTYLSPNRATDVSEKSLNPNLSSRSILLVSGVIMVKRIEVTIDPDLVEEAKKWNVNIEEATLRHFEYVKRRFS